MHLRHQLAAHSPVRADAWLRAAMQAFRIGADPRPALAALLRQQLDADRVLLCGSGTQALQLGIEAQARGAREDTIVALPAFACYDVASAAIGAGVRVALYDINPATLAPDLESLERVLRNGASVAVIASLYGVPIPWEPIASLASRHGARLVEDAAQGQGASWNGRPLGTLGDVSIVSFGRGKGWSGGQGGAVLARGEPVSLPERLPERSPMDDVKVAMGLGAQWTFGRPSVYGLPRSVPQLGLGETTYKPPVAPRSMTRGAATVALRVRPASIVEDEARRANANDLLRSMRSIRSVQPVEVPPGAIAGYLRLPILLSGAIEGDQWLRLERLGVARSYPSTLDAVPALRASMVSSGHGWPGARLLAERLVTLPTHSRTAGGDRAMIGSVLAGSLPHDTAS